MVTNFQSGINVGGAPVTAGSSRGIPIGNTFHVRKTTDAGYGEWYGDLYSVNNVGQPNIWETIEGAVGVLQDFDTIYIYPGEWTPSGTLAITKKHVKILAADLGPNCGLSGTDIWQYYYGANVPVFTLNGANNVEIAGFRIIPWNAGTAIGISIGETTECKGTWIHDNILYAIETGTGPTHIRMGSSGKEAQYTLIENNYIYAGGNKDTPSGMIDWVHATRSMIRNNNFMVMGNYAGMGGVYVADAAYTRGHIINNTFGAFEQSLTASASYAVKFAAAQVGGDFVVSGNETVNFTAPFSDIGAEILGLNWNASTVVATG